MLTSVVSYPDRGPYGKSDYRGNCSGYLIKELLEHYKPKSDSTQYNTSNLIRIMHEYCVIWRNKCG